MFRQQPGVKIEECLEYSQNPDHPMNEVSEIGDLCTSRSSAKNPLRLAQRNKGTGISIQGLSEKEFFIKKSDSVKTVHEFVIFNYDETNVQKIYSMSFLPGLFQGQYHGICCFRFFFFHQRTSSGLNRHA